MSLQALEAFSGYNACVDWPAATFYDAQTPIPKRR